MKKDKITLGIVIVYCLAVATVCLYVPWKVDTTEGLLKEAVDYSPLWSPPALSGIAIPGAFVSVDVTRLMLELIVLTVIAVVAVSVTQWAKKK